MQTDGLLRWVDAMIAFNVTELDILREQNAQLKVEIEQYRTRDGELLLAHMENEALRARVESLEKALSQHQVGGPQIKVISYNKTQHT